MNRSQGGSRKRYSLPYHGPFRTLKNQGERADDLGPDQDYPMDDFDRRLLAGNLSQSFLETSQAPSPDTFPPYHWPSTGYSHDNRGSKGYDLPLPIARSHQQGIMNNVRGAENPLDPSSSPAYACSSPTVSSLQSRSRASQRPGHNKVAAMQNQGQASKETEVEASKILTSGSKLPPTQPNPPCDTPVIQGIRLVPADRLPDHLRSVFSFPLFNAVQSKCFSTAFETNDNMVVSAPTGSGKTVIMELAICRLLRTTKNEDFKVVYQGPTKSLCSERHKDWTSKFKSLGLQCAELTGDVEYVQLKAVQTAHIIIATPEKWDSVTRKWRDNAKLMQMIKLFLVDEVHILNGSRGATLEAVVSRMKTAGSSVRFIALSATVPNSNDIATWLGRSSTAQHLPAHREVFSEDFRPAKLEKHVIGYNCGKNAFAIDSMLNKEIPTIINRYAKRRPVMIFCLSKNSAMKTASSLSKLWLSTIGDIHPWNALKQQIQVINHELQELLSTGVAFHHSGLDISDRKAIEQAFLDGNVSIICSTSTLAVGVNLPCYLVILKGTSCWTETGIREYTSLDVMQMLGRAGRPQYETSACAVILTCNDKVRHYEDMVSGQEILESTLHQNLIEHLNAEVGIGTIHDVESAKKWLSSTFLSVRLQQNPAYYRLPGADQTHNAERLLEQICERDLNLLEDAQMVEKRRGLRCTEYGNAMARYYVRYGTMLSFLRLQKEAKIADILHNLAQAQEFDDFKIRSGEKALYKELNKANDIRFPIKIDIALPAHKVMLMVQAHLGGVTLDKLHVKHAAQFRQDSLAIMNQCNRLIRCIVDVHIHRQDAISVRNALEVCRSLAAGVWDNTPMQLKQIESIGDVTARKLASAGIGSVDALLNTESNRVEIVLGKSQPFGSTLLKKAARFPNLRVSVKEIHRKRKEASESVEIALRCEVGHLNDSLPAFFNRKAVHVCFLCETSYGKLLDFRRFPSRRLQNGEEIFLTASLDRPCNSIKCHVMCDEIAGTHRSAELKMHIPDEWFSLQEKCQNESDTINDNVQKDLGFLDGFDDAGISDDDFLAVEANVEMVDMVEDDTDHVSKTYLELQPAARQTKRKATGDTSHKTVNEKVKKHRPSVRLPNGNWTCQHNCNENGKDCKHKCCKEGVERPKKRTRTEISELKPGRSIKDIIARSSALSVKPESTTIHDIDDVLRKSKKLLESISAADDDLTKVKLGTSGKTLIASNQAAPSTEKMIKDDTEFDFVGFPSTVAILSKASKVKVKDDFSRIDDRNNECFDDAFDLNDTDIDFTTCDWDNFDLPTCLTLDISQSTRFEVERSQRDRDQVSVHHMEAIFDQRPSVFAQREEKRLFVSPEQTMSSLSKPTPGGVADATFDKGIDMFDDIDDAELAALGPELQSNPNIVSAKSRSAGSGTSTDRNNTEPTPVPNEEFIYNPERSEAARQKQLHDADQKKRWEGLPAWLYEEYGPYIDLI